MRGKLLLVLAAVVSAGALPLLALGSSQVVQVGVTAVTQTEFTAFGKPAILFTRSTDGNRTWMEPVQINDLGGNASFQDSFSAAGKDPQTVDVTFGAFSNAGLPNWNRIYRGSRA